MPSNLFSIFPKEKITLEKLKDLLKSIGFVVHQVNSWELEIRVVYNGITSNNCITVKFIPTQYRLVLESSYNYNIKYNDLVFKECMNLSLVYDLIKIVFQEVDDESDYNFRVVASYPISYSAGFYPKQIIADFYSFDNVLDNLPYDFESLLVLTNCEKIR